MLGWLVCWVISGALLFTSLGVPVVMRTQESRVLETAREMLGAPFEQWMLPRVNGHLRMQKPPLAYWLTAASFKAFGVGEVQGRIPAALASWVAVGVTMLMARRLFGTRAALFTTAALVGSVMFYRHARFEETDLFVMTFVTIAIAAIWHAFGIDDNDEVSSVGAVGLYHLSAVAMALAVLSKGPGGLFPLVFLVGLCSVERYWRPLRTFALSGAPITLLALALPWFVYVWYHPSSEALANDMELSMTGKGWKLPLVYVFPLMTGLLPWTALFVVGVVAAVRQSREESRVRGVLVWSLAILIPLCLWGNKQKHYLLPLIPPLMILVGWQIERMIRSREADANRSDPTTVGGNVGGTSWRLTLIAYSLTAIAVPVAGYYVDGQIDAIDVIMTLLVAGTAGMSIFVQRQRGFTAGISTLASANLAVITFGLSYWASTTQPINNRTLSDAITSHYGAAPLVFVGREHLPICWQLRQVIPTVKGESQLAEMAAKRPGLVAIEVLEKGAAPTTPMLVEQMRFDDNDDKNFIAGPVDVRLAKGPLDLIENIEVPTPR